MTSQRNAFLALCNLAGAEGEDWCWKIPCTTCGHMHFRHSFRQLAKGKHPDSSDWEIRKATSPQRLEALAGSLGELSLEEQQVLAEIVATVSVAELASTCKFSDWLGYLGLALFHTARFEASSRCLTNALAPQLLQMVSTASPAAKMLRGMLDASSGTLDWRCLATIEAGIAQSKK